MNRHKDAYDPVYAVNQHMSNARYVTSQPHIVTPMPPYRPLHPIPAVQPRPLPPTPAVSVSTESAPAPPPRPSKPRNRSDNTLQSSVLPIPSTLAPTTDPLNTISPDNTIPPDNIKTPEENKATLGNTGSTTDPLNTISPDNIKTPEENKTTSGKYKYSYIIATDSINDTSSTNDADENSNSNSYEPNMPFNILKERVKSLNDAGDKIYVIVKIKSNKTLPVVKSIKIEKAPIYTIYKNYKKILNIERNAGEERLDEALNDFKNACVIKYGDNCVIISYANEEETIKNKLIDFDDTLELLFDIRFKKVRLVAIPGVKDFITKLDDNGKII